VVDTASYFTFWGQAFLLLLIQLGGLGMLSLTSLIIVALGKRLSLRSETVTTGSRLSMPDINVRQLTLDIAKFTFLFEAVGAFGLWLAWAPKLGWWEAIWPATFHSVSAFCNAGFSTFSDSVVGWQSSPLTLMILAALIIIGGLGFLTLEECYLKIFDRQWSRRHRVSLHSRLVILTTVWLLLGGGTLFAILEWRGVLSELAWSDRVSNALFMSVTARTAGFNSIHYAEACDSSNFATMLLMIIGGSPGSTAGGLKTTSFALIGLVAWSKLRGRETTVFASRSLPEDTLKRAVGLMVILIGVIAVGTLLLLLSESTKTTDNGFLKHAFEVVSATNTVGLSLGVTDQLNPFSRFLLTGLMFMGRVGPLTLVAAFVLQRAKIGQFRLAYEDVTVG
jgi:trk system potassium uptake protein TrkH